MSRLLFVAALTAALFAHSAQAGEATLGAVKGEVVVGSATGFSAAKAGAALKPGDRIIARSGGATIRYADGCEKALPQGGMVVIAPKSPCAGGPGLVTATEGASAQFIKLPTSPGAYVAGAGTLVIIGALLYGAFGVSD